MTGRVNVGEFQNSEDEVLRPESVDDVRQIIAEAGSDRGIHVFSRGYNWGLGSSVPLGCRPLSVSMRNLSEIRGIDVDAGWCIVEPGVAQADLASALVGTGRMLNVTASSALTSVLGNALDRGVGLRRHRTEDLLGLEVTLADGTSHRVGWWPDAGAGAAPYRHGVGPDLLGLFTQSNLGVVTAGVVALLRRPPATAVVKSVIDAERTPEVLAAAANALATGLINAVPKVYSPRARSSYSGTAGTGEAILYFAVDGQPGAIDSLSSLAVADLGLVPEATTVFTGAESLPQEIDPITELVVRGYSGDVSAHDALVEATLGASPADVDDHGRGWIFFLPLLPVNDADLLRSAHAVIDGLGEPDGPAVGATANLISPDIVDLVVSISFDRATQAAEAHTILTTLHERFRDLGVVPYRLDAAHPAAPTDPLISTVRDAMDPGRRFSAGRYLPDDRRTR